MCFSDLVNSKATTTTLGRYFLKPDSMDWEEADTEIYAELSSNVRTWKNLEDFPPMHSHFTDKETKVRTLPKPYIWLLEKEPWEEFRSSDSQPSVILK